MIRINLIKTEKAREKKRPSREFTPSEMTKQLGFLAIFVVTIGVCAFFWFNVQGRISVLRDEVASATRERDRLLSVKQLVDRLEGERNRLNLRLEVLSDLKNNLRSPLHTVFFIYLAQQENQGVVLTDLTEANSGAGLINVTIHGLASQESLNKFSETLMNEPIVDGIDINSQIGDRFEIRVRFRQLNGFKKATEDQETETEAVADAGRSAVAGAAK